ncbi:MAG: Kelch repeat-containing protein, partial [Bacteroidales bacterium]
MKHLYIFISLFLFPVLVYSQCNYSYGKWDTTLSSMPGARSSCSALVYHDSIFVLGGLRNMAAPECVSQVDVYVPATDTWITGITEFPFPRGCQHACLVGDKIYAFGGSRVSGESLTAFDSLHIYDIQSNSWEKGQCLPVEIGYFAADTINGKVYVAGGGGSGYSIFNSLYEYDPELDNWTEKASMSTSRWGTFARSWKGKLYVFGGYAGSDWTISRTIEVYDPETDEWTNLSSAITPRTSGSMFLLDGKLYVIGGYYNPSSTSYNHTKIISMYDIAT